MTLTRLRRVAVAAAVVAVGALPGAAGAEGARPIQEGVKLLAVPGFDGWAAPGLAYPVTVTVTADRLIEGTLQLDAEGFAGRTVVERDIELTGGNTATYHLLVAPEPSDQLMAPELAEAVGQAIVRLVVDGKVVAATEVEGRFDAGQELVGVLPEARAALGAGAELPEVVPLMIEVGTARPVEVDSELLELGAAGFGALDQVVTTPAELADLPQEHREALLAWVEAGGQLLVAGDVEELPAATLPDGWVPAAGGGVRAGLGRVRSVTSTWQDELVPSPARSRAEEGMTAINMAGPMASSSIGGRLAEDAGASLPPGGRLGVLLVLYVAVVGPLAYFGLRRFGRRKRPAAAAKGDDDDGDSESDNDDVPAPAVGPIRRPLAAWAVVPVLALASTGVMVGAGGEMRRHAASAHVTVYEVGSEGALATTWSLLSNPGRKGAVGLELPDGWTATAASTALWFQDSSPTVRVKAGDDGVEASTRPPAGGFGMIQSSGPAAGMADALEVTAESAEDDVVRGTVRNQLDVELEEVVVLVGRSALVEVGTLAPGEEKPFVVESASQTAFDPQPENQVWPDPMDDGGGWRGGDVIIQAPDGGVIIGVEGEAEAEAVIDVDKAEEIQVKPALPRAQGLVPLGSLLAPRLVLPEQPAPPTIVQAPDDQPVPLPAPPPMPGPDGGIVVPGDIGPVMPGFPGRMPDGEADDGPTMLAAWSQLMAERGGNFRPNGQAVAVGWTDDLEPPVQPSGSGRVSRSRSAVVARTTVQPAGDRLTDAASVRSLLRGPGHAGSEEIFFGIAEAVVAYDVPATVGDRPLDPSRLMFNVLGEFTKAEVWTPGGWVALPDVPENQDAQVPVPAGAVVGGQIFVRWAHPDGLFQRQRDFVLYEKET